LDLGRDGTRPQRGHQRAVVLAEGVDLPAVVDGGGGGQRTQRGIELGGGHRGWRRADVDGRARSAWAAGLVIGRGRGAARSRRRTAVGLGDLVLLVILDEIIGVELVGLVVEDGGLLGVLVVV